VIELTSIRQQITVRYISCFVFVLSAYIFSIVIALHHSVCPQVRYDSRRTSVLQSHVLVELALLELIAANEKTNIARQHLMRLVCRQEGHRPVQANHSDTPIVLSCKLQHWPDKLFVFNWGNSPSS